MIAFSPPKSCGKLGPAPPWAEYGRLRIQVGPSQTGDGFEGDFEGRGRRVQNPTPQGGVVGPTAPKLNRAQRRASARQRPSTGRKRW